MSCRDFEQELIASEENGNLVIRDLVVKDYPIILRLAQTKYLYLPVLSRESGTVSIGSNSGGKQ